MVELAGRVAFEGLRCLDNFEYHVGSEGLHMRHNELLIYRRATCWQRLIELTKSESGDDGHSVRIMGEIEAEGLVEREG